MFLLVSCVVCRQLLLRTTASSRAHHSWRLHAALVLPVVNGAVLPSQSLLCGGWRQRSWVCRHHQAAQHQATRQRQDRATLSHASQASIPAHRQRSSQAGTLLRHEQMQQNRSSGQQLQQSLSQQRQSHQQPYQYLPSAEEDEGDSLDAFVVETRLMPVSLSQIPDTLPDEVSSAACLACSSLMHLNAELSASVPPTISRPPVAVRVVLVRVGLQ